MQGTSLDGLETMEVAVEYQPGLCQQLSLGERLLDQGHARVEAALGSQDGPGITGHEQHFDTGLDRPHFLRDFVAEHSRHHDVGDEQVDLAWVAAGEVKSFWAVCGGEHVVAVAGEDPPVTSRSASASSTTRTVSP